MKQTLRYLAGPIWGMILAALFFSAPAAAQDAQSAPALEDGWQAVITEQITAFRNGDAAAALELAGSGFKQNYADPDRFMQDILSWGYEPILQSVSHSFGEYRPGGEGLVLQIVQVIGNDQGYYEAMYQLGYEQDGWRIQGVALSEKQGVGI